MSLLVVSTIMFGCSKSEIEEEVIDRIVVENVGSELTKAESIALKIQKKGDTKISQQEAVKLIEQFINSSSETKSSDKKTVNVKSTKVKKNKKGEDSYYEMTIETDKGTGYSVVSADERIPEMFCYVESGSLNDTVYNPGLRMFFRALPYYIEDQLSEYADIESLALSAQEKVNANIASAFATKAIPPFDPNVWTYVGERIIETPTERIKTVPVKWDQVSPFNNNVPNIPNTNYKGYAGCVTIAFAQIMAYHKKPYKNIITTSDWNEMIINDYHPKIPILIASMLEYLNPTYTIGGTSISEGKGFDLLKNNGYTCLNHTYNISYNFFFNALNYGPTIIGGTSLTEGGHTWVVDGAKEIKKDIYEVYTYNDSGKIYEYLDHYTTLYSKYLKYNWGWKGFNDGWFSYGSFDGFNNKMTGIGAIY